MISREVLHKLTGGETVLFRDTDGICYWYRKCGPVLMVSYSADDDHEYPAAYQGLDVMEILLSDGWELVKGEKE